MGKGRKQPGVLRRLLPPGLDHLSSVPFLVASFPRVSSTRLTSSIHSAPAGPVGDRWMEGGLRQRAVGSFPLPLLHYPRSSGALGGPPRFLSLRSFPRRTAFGRLRRVCDGGRMTTEHGELRKEGPYRCSPNQEAIWALSSLSHRYHYCLTLLPRLSRFIPSLRYTLLRSVRDA